MPTKNEIFSYKNEFVIKRFAKIYPVSIEESEDIFNETIKWLYLASLEKQTENRLFINNDLLIIDEMWHNFILFTKDYQDFCFNFLGVYIHHQPNINSGNKIHQEDYYSELRSMMSFVFDTLGEETLLKWFELYPNKYSRWVRK